MEQLSDEAREQFGRIADAAFANPFGGERRAHERRFAENDDPDLPRSDALEQMLQRIRRQLRPLPPAGTRRVDLTAIDPADRDAVETAFLFECFHRRAETIDAHIDDQLERGDDPMPVDFADSLLGELTGSGIDRERAVRFVGLFFQLRRAFHFISERLVGDSASIAAIRRQVWNDIFGPDIRFYERRLWDRLEDFSVLFAGPTGTGKGTAASAVGYSGWIPFEPDRGRFAVSFTSLYHPVHLAEYAESVVESEMFGHVEGAFTGAVETTSGVFDRSSRWGTVFLDEISEVPDHIQAKLLRVLQDRQFTRVGGHDPRRFDGRTLASTNRPLDRAIADGELREDLYYRICSDVVRMPPLRTRLDECPDALETLVADLVERELGAPDHERAETITAAIRESHGRRYPWPGNVRELQQCVRRHLLTGTCPSPAAAGADREDATVPAWLEAVEAGEWTTDELLSRYCAHLYEKLDSYAAVGRRVELDRRTVKKYVRRVP